jgi:hypothetical protein
VVHSSATNGTVPSVRGAPRDAHREYSKTQPGPRRIGLTVLPRTTRSFRAVHIPGRTKNLLGCCPPPEETNLVGSQGQTSKTPLRVACCFAPLQAWSSRPKPQLRSNQHLIKQQQKSLGSTVAMICHVTGHGSMLLVSSLVQL